MRVGLLTGFDLDTLQWARHAGFRSLELLTSIKDRFHPAGPDTAGWKGEAERVAGTLRDLGLRCSCIGGFYHNNLDPGKEASARSLIRGTIDLAVALGVDRVAGFAGRWPLDAPLEDSLPRFEVFWADLARYAADRGVLIAFEHCPMGPHHLPPGGINMMATPAMWERAFQVSWADNLGIEWDASHLICQRIDPVLNLHLYGDRIRHVHAKDARVERHLYDRYGIYHPGSIEHCFPGLGDADWPAIVKALYRVGYDSDLNIEGWHDSVYRDPEPASTPKASEHGGSTPPRPRLERTGLEIGLHTLRPLVDER